MNSVSIFVRLKSIERQTIRDIYDLNQTQIINYISQQTIRLFFSQVLIQL
jgi:hypothetical protein